MPPAEVQAAPEHGAGPACRMRIQLRTDLTQAVATSVFTTAIAGTVCCPAADTC
jgi:hypothetical protein